MKRELSDLDAIIFECQAFSGCLRHYNSFMSHHTTPPGEISTWIQVVEPCIHVPLHQTLFYFEEDILHVHFVYVHATLSSWEMLVRTTLSSSLHRCKGIAIIDVIYFNINFWHKLALVSIDKSRTKVVLYDVIPSKTNDLLLWVYVMYTFVCVCVCVCVRACVCVCVRERERERECV